MKFGSALAIYFIIWWTVLFAILPFRVRNSADVGKSVESGHDAGAPVAPQLLWKAGVTTIVAFLVFGIVYAVMATDLLTGMQIPFFDGAPKL